jgi:hypothetical protein
VQVETLTTACEFARDGFGSVFRRCANVFTDKRRAGRLRWTIANAAHREIQRAWNRRGRQRQTSTSARTAAPLLPDAKTMFFVMITSPAL